MTTMFALLSLLPLLATIGQALSADQIRSVFGTSDLVGATKTLPRFNFSVVANASTCSANRGQVRAELTRSGPQVTPFMCSTRALPSTNSDGSGPGPDRCVPSHVQTPTRTCKD